MRVFAPKGAYVEGINFQPNLLARASLAQMLAGEDAVLDTTLATLGEGRFKHKHSLWDVVHPGRLWAEKCAPHARLHDDLASMDREYVTQYRLGGDGPKEIESSPAWYADGTLSPFASD